MSRRRRRWAGQGLVEFALVIALLVFVVMILVDFGRVVYTQHTITQASREGARAGAVAQSYAQPKYDQIRARTRLSAPAVGLQNADIVGAPGACPVADADSPSTCFYPDGLTAGTGRVVVRVTATINLVTPGIALIVGNAFTLSAESVGYIQCTGCEGTSPTAPPP